VRRRSVHFAVIDAPAAREIAGVRGYNKRMILFRVAVGDAVNQGFVWTSISRVAHCLRKDILERINEKSQ
jgi:hypothetical protein